MDLEFQGNWHLRTRVRPTTSTTPFSAISTVAGISLLSLDPRDPGVFTAGQFEQPEFIPDMNCSRVPTVNFWRSRRGPIFGPYAGELLPWLNDMTIIRGMSMETRPMWRE